MDKIDLVNKQIQATAKTATKLTKEEFKESVATVSAQLETLIRSLDNLKGSDLTTFTEKILARATERDNFFSALYLDIAKATGDRKPAFAQYVKCAQHLITLLKMLDRNTNTLFLGKYTTLYNVKISQTVALLVLELTQQFVNCAVYLYHGILYEVIVNDGEHELTPPPPYRYNYIKSREKLLVDLLKTGSTPQGTTSLINEFDQLRRTGDSDLLTETNQLTASPVAGRMGLFNPLSWGVDRIVRIFRYFGERGIAVRRRNYQKMCEEKEWLQSHADLLKLQLSNTDPNSDEYRKAVKIIDTYNAMITDLDSKIDQYLNS